MQRLMDTMRNLVEKSAFGVCQAIGDRVGIRASKIRMYFIYTSFIALGSPLIFYLIAAFWLNIKKNLQRSRKLIWD